MSRHYLLDGYNIIKKYDKWANKPLQEGREALLKFIERSIPQEHLQKHVTVVFDGSRDMGSSGQIGGVIFTDVVSADDKIKRIVEEAGQPNFFIVVSDDKGITFYVRSLGASVMSVDEFLALGQSTPKKKNCNYQKKNIARHIQDEINNEMKDVWLKEE